MPRQTPLSYFDALLAELSAIEEELAGIVEASTIEYVNPNRSGSRIFFVGAADWGVGELNRQPDRSAYAATATSA